MATRYDHFEDLGRWRRVFSMRFIRRAALLVFLLIEALPLLRIKAKEDGM
jgi:hypothetical protein